MVAAPSSLDLATWTDACVLAFDSQSWIINLMPFTVIKHFQYYYCEYIDNLNDKDFSQLNIQFCSTSYTRINTLKSILEKLHHCQRPKT